MEGKTHFERVIGGTPEDKAAAIEMLQKLFETRDERFTPYELEKTPGDIALIEQIEGSVDETVAGYGGDPKPLPLENIYVLKPNAIAELTKGRLFGGIHSPLGLSIGVEKPDSKLLFSSSLVHELLHLKSVKAVRVDTSDDEVHLYRSGLSMFDRKDVMVEPGKEKEYFGILEEAIVAECTRRLIQKIGDKGLFDEEAQAVGDIKNWVTGFYREQGIPEEEIKKFEEEVKYISRPQEMVDMVLSHSEESSVQQAYATGIFNFLNQKGLVEMVERYTERKLLYELLDTIAAASEGEFADRDAVFEAFARANFSGNYMPLARSIEKHLGKGAFRKIAETFSMSKH